MALIDNNYHSIVLTRLSIRNEVLILVMVFVAFLLIGLIASPRMRLVHIDEVAYTEPAANLSINGDFTSSVLWYQEEGEFFAGSTVLYPLLLSGWIHIWGFDILSVRMFNFILAVLSVIMLLSAAGKLNLIKDGLLRIILVVLLLSGNALSNIYVNGRYDTLCFFLMASMLIAYASVKKTKLYIVLFLLSFLIPFAGLSLVIYTLILSSIILVFQFRSFIKPWACIMIGIFVGISLLICILSYHEVIDDYLKYSFGHAKLLQQTSRFDMMIIMKNLSNRILELINPTNYQCAGFMGVKSFLALLIGIFIVLLHSVLINNSNARHLISFGMISALVIPAAMCIAGIYSPAYSWMAYTPLTICVCASVNRTLVNDKRKVRRYIFIAVYLIFFSVTISYGLPNNLIRTIKPWNRMDYSAVDEYISKVVEPGDYVYSDFSAYYAIKKRAAYILFPTHLRMATNKEKEKISLIIFNPQPSARKKWNPGFTDIKNALGGEWCDTGFTLGIKGGYKQSSAYKLKAYRRVLN
jgi:hypothetical protein